MPWITNTCSILTSVVLALSVLAAHAQDSYPTRPVTLVVPLPAGSDLDMAARLLAESFTTQLKQAVVVDNRAGAGGLVGMQRLATAPADGYTLGLAFTGALVLAPHLKQKPPYDPTRDFTPIGLLAQTSNALLVPASSKIHSMADLVAAAKAQPGKLNFGSWGTGSGGHLAGVVINRSAQIQTEHIAYKGTAEAQNALQAGEIDFTFLGYGTAARSVASGRARAIAVLARERSPLFPQAPTLVEAGFPVVQQAWFGLLGPKGLPPEVVTRLEAALAVAAKEPKLVQALGNVGITAAASNARQFASTIQADYADWGEAAKLAKLPKD